MADFTALKTAIQNAIKQNGNEEITGTILQQVMLAVVTTLGDNQINALISSLSDEQSARQNADNTLQTNINAEQSARQLADSTLQSGINNERDLRIAADNSMQNAITAIGNHLNEGYIYVGIATTATNPSTPIGKVFYIAVAAGTYTNFLNSSSQPLVLTQGINILKYNGTAWSVEQVWGVDDEPTAGSDNLVKSGGVLKETADIYGELSLLSGIEINLMRGFINASNNFALTTNRYGLCIPVNAGDVLKVIGGTNTGEIAFLKTNVYETHAVSYSDAEGYAGKKQINAGSTYNYTIPSDCKYLYITYKSEAPNLPEEIEINDMSIIRTLRDIVKKEIDYLESLTSYDSFINGVKPAECYGFINSSNVFAYNENRAGVCIPVKNGDNITIIANLATHFAILKENLYIKKEAIFSDVTGFTERITIEANKTKSITVPSDGNFLYITTLFSTGNTIPSAIYVNGINIVDNIIQNLSLINRKIIESIYDNIAVYGTEGQVKTGFIGSTNAFSDAAGSGICVPVNSGDKVIIKAGSNPSAYCILKEDCYETKSALFVNDYPERQGLSAGRVSDMITIPSDGKYLHIVFTTANNDLTPVSATVNDIEIIVNAKREKEEKEICYSVANGNLLKKETDNLWIKNYLDTLYSASEENGYNPLLTKVQARKTAGCLSIAFGSDTHHGGAYATRYPVSNRLSSERSITLFNKITDVVCDAAIHGGDISCDYGTSMEKQLAFMREVIQMFHFSKPFFITKGNHDENNNVYEEVSLTEIDFSKETYYKRDFNTFTEVTEDTWDGTELFRINPQLITDKEFKNVVQKYLCPSAAVWGDGAYFYYDFADYKIRLVVLNSFPVNEARAVFEGNEWKWFAETALDLSGKENPTDWAVVTLKHTKASQSEHVAIIDAFVNGNSVSGSKQGVTWNIDYGSVNGGGCKYIGNLHGHEHAYNYTNANGYNDMGFPMLNCKPSDWGDASKYGISVVSIDNTNNKIYIDKINGESVYYDY